MTPPRDPIDAWLDRKFPDHARSPLGQAVHDWTWAFCVAVVWFVWVFTLALIGVCRIGGCP